MKHTRSPDDKLLGHISRTHTMSSRCNRMKHTRSPNEKLLGPISPPDNDCLNEAKTCPYRPGDRSKHVNLFKHNPRCSSCLTDKWLLRSLTRKKNNNYV